jgi:CheY-like chemotaxis protein
MMRFSMARILILEAESDLAARLGEAIQRAGMPVEIASGGGPQMLASLARHPPALIVLDLRVDGGRGVELCRAIREAPGGDLVPILFLGTGAEGVANFGDALAEGGDYYFSLPLDIDKIISKILTYVGVQRDEATQIGTPPAGTQAPDSKELARRVDRIMSLQGTPAPVPRLAPPREDQPEDEDRLSELERQLFDDGVTEPAGTAAPLDLAERPTLQMPAVDLSSASATQDAGSLLKPPKSSPPPPEPPTEVPPLETEESPKDLEAIDQRLERILEDSEGGEEDSDVARKLLAEVEERNRAFAQLKALQNAVLAQPAENDDTESLAGEPAGDDVEDELEEEDRKIREFEENLLKEAEEKARREAEEKARREAEEKARREAEEKARRDAEEHARREAE